MPKDEKVNAGKANAAKGRRTYRPRVKEWHRTAAYRDVRQALEEAAAASSAPDPLRGDRIEEYMSLWCQRQALYDDVRKRGPTVVDDRGRISENRSISLGVQVSKQMMALLGAMGLGPKAAGQGVREAETEEDDPL